MAETFDASNLTARERRLSLGAVYACMFAVGVGMGLSLPLLSLILERNGVSATLNGANTTVGALAMIVVSPFIPAIAARLGTARFLIACYIVAAAALVSFRATNDLVAWFILRFVLNSALQGLFIVSEVWINQIAAESNRGRLVAIYTSIFSAGFALGPLIIQGLGTTGWAPFIAGGAAMLLAMVPVLVAGHLVPAVEHAPARAMFGFILRSPSAAAAGAGYGAIEACAATFLTIYAVRLGSPETDATLLVAALGLGNMLLVPFLGWLADKIDRRSVLMLCGFAGVIGAALLPATGGAGLAGLILVFIWGGFIAGLYAVGLAHLGANFKGSELAAANAAYAILYALGSMVGPGLGGIGMDVWNPQGLPTVLGLISAALVAVIAVRAATIPRPRSGPTPG